MTTTHNLRIGGKYAVTFYPPSDPRRAPKVATRKLVLVDEFRSGIGLPRYFRFTPACGRGYRVVVAEAEIISVEEA